MRGGQRRDAPDLRHAAGAGDVGLGDVQRPALEQVLEVEARELALARGDGDGRRATHLGLAGMIVRRHRLLEPGDIVRLELPGELDGGRDLERAVRVDHQLDAGPEPTAGRLHPAHALGDREPVVADHAHLGGGETLGRVARKLRLGLVAGRPAAAGIAPHRAAHRTKRLVERNAERLRLHVPHRDVDAGNRLHDDAAASAFIGLRHPTLERRRAARAVVHLLVDALGEHRLLADDLRRELVRDDGRDDRRAPERRTDAREPAVGLDTNERRIALDLRSEVGAVPLLLRHGRRHGNGGYSGDFHGPVPSRDHVALAAAPICFRYHSPSPNSVSQRVRRL